MEAVYLSILSLQRQRWTLASIWFSLAASVKMNVLLFAPAFCFLHLKGAGWNRTIQNAIISLLIQVLVALPFRQHPISYISSSFELTRKFLWQWTVNWRFVGQSTFESTWFSLLLLIGHMTTLIVFYRKFSRRKVSPMDEYWPEWVLYVMSTTQLIGIVFARSLHYQFYSWYFWTVPFLLSCTLQKQNWVQSLLVMTGFVGALEWCWLQYPSTVTSSALLFCLNAGLLVKLYQYSGTQQSRIPISRKQA
jgi:alpha-1,3-mannosyltransferase